MSTSNWIFAPLVGAWRGDTLIQRSVSNASIYKPGGMGGLSSTRDTIFVTDRPVIEDIQFTIIPPSYTGEKHFIHPGNITDITEEEQYKNKIFVV